MSLLNIRKYLKIHIDIKETKMFTRIIITLKPRKKF